MRQDSVFSELTAAFQRVAAAAEAVVVPRGEHRRVHAAHHRLPLPVRALEAAGDAALALGGALGRGEHEHAADEALLAPARHQEDAGAAGHDGAVGHRVVRDHVVDLSRVPARIARRRQPLAVDAARLLLLLLLMLRSVAEAAPQPAEAALDGRLAPAVAAVGEALLVRELDGVLVQLDGAVRQRALVVDGRGAAERAPVALAGDRRLQEELGEESALEREKEGLNERNNRKTII